MSRSNTNLRQSVQRVGPLDYKRAARYVEQVSRQLAELHRNGKVHTDVRPEKILLNEAGNASLDERQSGLFATSVETPDPDYDDAAAKYAVEAADYLAPELALNAAKADGRADFYSLGCVLYFMLVGRPPFANGNVSERLLMHQHAKPEPISQFRPDVPEALAQICETMMSKNPSDRYASTDEVIQAIAAWRQSARWF